METPQPLSIEIKKDKEEINLINFNLENQKYNCDLYMINENLISFKIKDNTNKSNKYEKKYNLSDFKNMNKYFKMFDTLKELNEELIGMIKEKNLEFESCNDNNIILKLNIKTRNNNIIHLNLPKVELNFKDKLNLILEEINELKKSNIEKDNEINNLKKKIEKLEQENLNLKEYINNKFKEFENILSKNKEFNNINCNSKILNDKSEIEFLLTNISKNSKSLKLLYSSDEDGENEEKLKNSYIEKNDILVLVKTKENKRFGGYAHEKFKDKEFDQIDLKAFLFNLDKKKVYNSSGNMTTIWKHKFFLNSINFGTGTDLRIFHKFFSNQGYTLPSGDYDYNGESYSLNGKQYFDVQILEIFQVNFNN